MESLLPAQLRVPHGPLGFDDRGRSAVEIEGVIHKLMAREWTISGQGMSGQITGQGVRLTQVDVELLRDLGGVADVPTGQGQPLVDDSPPRLRLVEIHTRLVYISGPHPARAP